MVRITIYRDKEKECAGFQTKGHAEYSEEGSDVVCAAVSVLIINTMNAIEKFTEDKFTFAYDEEDGQIDFQVKEKPSKETALLLKTMILGLEDMADDENYAEYIQLTFKEV